MDNNQPSQKPLMHSIPDNSASVAPGEMPMGKVTFVFFLVIIVGVLSGFTISYVQKAVKGRVNNPKSESSMSNKSDVAESAGVADKKTFKDSAEGTLENGGDKSGAGSFKLIRPGGESQTVFLTSSTVDLTEFVGKKVRIYGETFASDKVGWLMDVGFIEVLK